ncbi:hypothetical protein [Mongoliibacter ruber]|uniref:Transcription elongation GreA/GreB family factor n=1 Tax=Mongoliibacter ruber TaxID=1750599 RepID=A0A2T0WVC7_9BACT|nr:hypothetical protein [Mongoliibacter ruber]PRY90534.1 hypothetical protein CLW00_101195 [Mongoliibacter ruber]
METQSDIKEKLLQAAKSLLKEQIVSLERELKELQHSSEAEEKSSAGDKFETHQEMLNQNRSILEKRKISSKAMLNQLNAVPVKETKTVEEGSLLKVPMGNIWVSVPFGKLDVEGVAYQLVSPDSPLIQAIWGQTEGSTANFRDKSFTIETLI